MKLTKNKKYYTIINIDDEDRVVEVTFDRTITRQGIIQDWFCSGIDETINVFKYKYREINHEIVLSDDDVFQDIATAELSRRIDKIEDKVIDLAEKLSESRTQRLFNHAIEGNLRSLRADKKPSRADRYIKITAVVGMSALLAVVVLAIVDVLV